MSDLKKITEQTTLGELAAQRAMLGITGLQIFADLGGGARGALAHHATGAHIGRGRTEAIAIEDAFASVRRATLPEPLKAIAEGRTWPPLIEAEPDHDYDRATGDLGCPILGHEKKGK